MLNGRQPVLMPQQKKKTIDRLDKQIYMKNKRFVAGIDIFRAPAIMNASYFMNGILLTLSR